MAGGSKIAGGIKMARGIKMADGMKKAGESKMAVVLMRMYRIQLKNLLLRRTACKCTGKPDPRRTMLCAPLLLIGYYKV